MGHNVLSTSSTALRTAALTALVLTLASCVVAAQATSKHKVVQRPGGANQVQGLNGKVGDMLFTGYWRFQVQVVHTGLTSYTLAVPSAAQDFGRFRDTADFDSSTGIFTPKAGYVFDTIDCVAKNGQTSVQALDCWSPPNNTAITDDQGQSYQPMGYDMMTSGPWATKPMLQGSSEKMTILFAVPPGTNIKDLVVTLMSMGNGRTRKDVRVSLTPPTPSGNSTSQAAPSPSQ